MPKLSIITVNLNNAEGLRKTIESVVNQTFNDYEYIIIDGGSTVGSVDIIKQYADKITYWVSEPDKGIYNAMNKGIKVAKGEYCYFLNSGDYLKNNFILNTIFSKKINKDYIYGNIELNNYTLKYPKDLTFYFFFTNTICHQAIFIKSNLFKKFGFYDEKLTIVADWEFYLRTFILANSTYIYLDETISVYDTNGMSSKPELSEKLNSQRKKTLLKYFPMMYEDYSEIQK